MNIKKDPTLGQAKGGGQLVKLLLSTFTLSLSRNPSLPPSFQLSLHHSLYSFHSFNLSVGYVIETNHCWVRLGSVQYQYQYSTLHIWGWNLRYCQYQSIYLRRIGTVILTVPVHILEEERHSDINNTSPYTWGGKAQWYWQYQSIYFRRIGTVILTVSVHIQDRHCDIDSSSPYTG